MRECRPFVTMKSILLIGFMVLALCAFSLTPIVIDIGENRVTYLREFLDLASVFPDMDRGSVGRFEDAAHMDIVMGRFYPKVRLMCIRLPEADSPLDSYLNYANQLLKGTLENREVLLSYGAYTYDADSNYLSYLWFPVEFEGSNVMVSANLLLLVNGLAEFVPESSRGDVFQTYLEQARDFAKDNGIGIWKEEFAPGLSTEPTIRISKDRNTSARRLTVTVTGTYDTAYSGYISIKKLFKAEETRREITGVIPHIYQLELDDSWDNEYFNLDVRINTKEKDRKMTVTVRINDTLLSTRSTSEYSRDRVAIYMILAKYSIK